MEDYRLLPFTFSRVANKEVLVNEVGDMIIAQLGTVDLLVNHTMERNDLYKSLVSNFFVTESKLPHLFDVYAGRLAEKKRFLDEFTALHIFVLTLRCNQNCTYCQASSRTQDQSCYSMSKETMEKAVHLMYQSPSPYLTMEFQGGEPSLEPELLRYGIELSEEINQTEKRNINYVLCTNCINLIDEVMDICKQYKV